MSGQNARCVRTTMAGATPPPSTKSVLPRAFLFSASTELESGRYRSPSDATPIKLYTRFLSACAAAAELERKGATAEPAEERVTQSDASNWFERACKLEAHLYERAALCQKLLDASVAKEIYTYEARAEYELDVYLQQKRACWRADAAMGFEETETEMRSLPAAVRLPTPMKRSNVCCEIATEMIDKKRQRFCARTVFLADEGERLEGPPTPCDNACGMCAYCHE